MRINDLALSAFLLLLAAAARAQPTNDVRVTLRGCAEVRKVSIVLDGDENDELDLRHDPDGFWRGTWKGEQPLREKPAGSLRLFGARTNPRRSRVVADDVFNGNAAAFFFDCDVTGTRSLKIMAEEVPVKNPVPVSYCRHLPAVDRKQDIEVAECGHKSTTEEIHDWRFPYETIRLRLFSAMPPAGAPGLLLNDVRSVREKKDGPLAPSEIFDACARQHVEGRTNAPTASPNACALYDAKKPTVRITLEWKR
jgi:hypothetical protein